MSETASSGKTLAITVLVVVLLGALIASFIWWTKQGGERGFVAAIPLDDGNLAVIEARHRVLVVDPSGRVIRSRVLRERVSPFFWTPELLIFRARDQSVYALHLPELTEAEQFNEEIAGHHALRGRLTHPSVLPGGRVATEGRDGRQYVVDTEGGVERTELRQDGAPTPRWQTRAPGRIIARTTGASPGIEGAPDLSQLELVQPGAVMRWGQGQAVSFASPPGVLVLSGDIDMNMNTDMDMNTDMGMGMGMDGAGESEILSRVALDGTIAWSTPVAAMIDHAMGHAVHHLLWADVRGEEVVALVQAFRITHTESGAKAEYAQRLVHLSALDGTLVNATPIVDEHH